MSVRPSWEICLFHLWNRFFYTYFFIPLQNEFFMYNLTMPQRTKKIWEHKKAPITYAINILGVPKKKHPNEHFRNKQYIINSSVNGDIILMRTEGIPCMIVSKKTNVSLHCRFFMFMICMYLLSNRFNTKNVCVNVLHKYYFTNRYVQLVKLTLIYGICSAVWTYE